MTGGRERAVAAGPFPSRSRWLGPDPVLPAPRIVSLVPSLTEALFRLGAGASVVGRTAYCVSPQPEVAAVPVVGGTKDPDVAAVRDLAPDLVLAAREENTRARVWRLAETLPVLLSDPAGPEDVPALWWELGQVCDREAAAGERAEEVRSVLGGAGAGAGGNGPRVIYWVWRDPWMAAGHDTYISRLLAAAGLRNALPAELGRYPRVALDSIGGLQVAAHLFPSEPYEFVLPRDLEPFGRGRAEGGSWRLANGAVAAAVDGRLFSWYPSRTAVGLAAAAALRRRLQVEG